MRQDVGYAAGCVWVLARTAPEARRLAGPVLRNVFPSSPAVGVEAFPRTEYAERAGPRDFTAGVRLGPPTGAG